MSQAGILNVNGGGGGGSPIMTETGNSGGPVPPTANNLNVVGTGTTTVVGNPGTSTLTITPTAGGYPITPYVVGPLGIAGYQTIQAGLNAANAAGGGSVYVMPGTYNESLTLFGNTDVVGNPGNSDAATSGNSVIINGVHTPPTTGSFTFANVQLQSATHIFNSAAAGSAELILINVSCAITNGYTFNLPNWTGPLVTYNLGEASVNNGMVNNNGGAICFFISATHGAGTLNSMITSGTVFMQEVDLKCPWTANTGTAITCDYCIFSQPVTLAGTSSGLFDWSRFSTGSSAAIVMSSSGAIKLMNSVIDTSANPAISGAGAGTISTSACTFTQNSNWAGTLSASYLSNNAVNSISNYNLLPNAAIYTAIASDYYISVPSNLAPITVLLPNAPSTNRIFIIKDKAGNASANNISISTPSGTVQIDGQTIYKLTSNFESVSVVFNGTSYEVF